MPDEFERMIGDLQRQRTTVEQNFDDTAASQKRTHDILKKLEDLRRRAEVTEQEKSLSPAGRGGERVQQSR